MNKDFLEEFGVFLLFFYSAIEFRQKSFVTVHGVKEEEPQKTFHRLKTRKPQRTQRTQRKSFKYFVSHFLRVLRGSNFFVTIHDNFVSS